MPKLIYAAIASLDGYIEDEAGRFDWAMPDEEVYAFVNDLERPIGSYLYGRWMYARNLETVSSARTRIERDLDPDAVRRLKKTSNADIAIGGGRARRPGARPRPGRRVPPVPRADRGRRR